MEEPNKNEGSGVIVVEFKIYMHCNACERIVAKTISKFKGVEKFTTDMKNSKVVVTGRVDPQKVLKKLKKKTRKKFIEFVVQIDDTEKEASEKPVEDFPMFECCEEGEYALMMFSDENPNACSIM